MAAIDDMMCLAAELFYHFGTKHSFPFLNQKFESLSATQNQINGSSLTITDKKERIGVCDPTLQCVQSIRFEIEYELLRVHVRTHDKEFPHFLIMMTIMMAAERRLGRTATMDGRSRQAHVCTCGHFETLQGDGVTGGGLRQNGGMEASFVHLPSNVMTPPLAWTETTSHHASHEGFLETVRHASALLRAGQGKALPQESGDEGVSLCQDCIDRYDWARGL